MRIKEMISNKLKEALHIFTQILFVNTIGKFILNVWRIYYTDVSVIRVNKRGLLNGLIFFPGKWLDKRE